MADGAPLIGTVAAPVPEGASAEWFDGAGGLRLRAARFAPGGPARGSVVVSPGRTEPIEKYLETAADLTARGFVVLVHDWRGQGLSGRLLGNPLLGHAAGYADFLSDYAALLAAFEARLPRPWLALGHSMGGCLTLLALDKGERRFSAALLSAPMLGLRTGAVPRPIARLLAGLLSRLGQGGRAVPGPSAPSLAFEANLVTHDRVRYARNEAVLAACPALALGPPTWSWLDFAFAATADLARPRALAEVAMPVTIVTAGDELLVDNDAAEAAAARLPRGRHVGVPGAFHELLQETDEVRAVFWREFDALAAGLAPAPAVSIV